MPCHTASTTTIRDSSLSARASSAFWASPRPSSPRATGTRLFRNSSCAARRRAWPPAEAGRLARTGKLGRWLADCRVRTRDGTVKWIADSSYQFSDGMGGSPARSESCRTSRRGWRANGHCARAKPGLPSARSITAPFSPCHRAASCWRTRRAGSLRQTPPHAHAWATPATSWSADPCAMSPRTRNFRTSRPTSPGCLRASRSTMWCSTVTATGPSATSSCAKRA